ncbi:AG10B-like protein [Mya arenaria]|uniref:Dol-P-Glc:Glc(2)Man(9)GlcNAc(2)-PP-Dol alpha-1,2-glucosyltransferase n=1 Tax=Mya arenaria TaxID=6604 RepID=A0ABY7FYD2_MYAAR|nr:AG10B-like protein [Mya arenaria]
MFVLAVSFVLFSISTIFTFWYLYGKQNDPYMDEIFHVPQAKHFCDGNFTHWDPMITTLPGLYLMTAGLLQPIASLLNISIMEICTTYSLRGVNVLFCFGNFYLIYAILKKLHNPFLLAMSTLALGWFPVLYFFTFLYYTDPGAIFMVLLMYLFCLHDSHKMAAIFGVAAILFRQTNVIWVIYMAGLAIRKELSIWMRETAGKKVDELDKLSDWDLFKLTLTTLKDCALNKRTLLMKLLSSILKQVYGYLIVGIGFVLFIILNGGIVVGDKTQHTACLNFPQLFYFFTMANFFGVFHLTSPFKMLDFLKFCLKHPLYVIMFFALAFLMVNYYTHEHLYLLSDNRHYTFYVWHKIYKRHRYVKFALIPIYLYSIWAFIVELKHRDIYWKILYFVCLVVATVPQKLLEYRYFILPYLIYRLNMRYGTNVGLMHEVLLYIVLNIATLYLYAERPFKWSHEDGLQRFIW